MDTQLESSSTRIAVGRVWLTWRDSIWERKGSQRGWNRLASVELQDGKIAFIPSRAALQMGYVGTEASFPDGSSLEVHVETGDRYLTGDHGQFLQRTLWIVGTNGMKQQFVGSAVELNPKRMLTNLPNSGIPFRVIRVYDGQDGEHTETDITGEYASSSSKSWKRGVLAILLGTSSLWLGVGAGFSVRHSTQAIAIGVVGYAVTAILTLRTGSSKRSALIQAATLAPSYAAGYAVAVISVWHIFK